MSTSYPVTENQTNIYVNSKNKKSKSQLTHTSEKACLIVSKTCPDLKELNNNNLLRDHCKAKQNTISIENFCTENIDTQKSSCTDKINLNIHCINNESFKKLSTSSDESNETFTDNNKLNNKILNVENTTELPHHINLSNGQLCEHVNNDEKIETHNIDIMPKSTSDELLERMSSNQTCSISAKLNDNQFSPVNRSSSTLHQNNFTEVLQRTNNSVDNKNEDIVNDERGLSLSDDEKSICGSLEDEETIYLKSLGLDLRLTNPNGPSIRKLTKTRNNAHSALSKG